MCGGLAASVSRSPTQLIFYHGGRLLGYLSLGGLAGVLGESVYLAQKTETWFRALTWGGAVFIAFLLISMGFQVWKGTPPKRPSFLSNQMSKLNYTQSSSAFITGLFTIFLPCGWLHVFIIAAAASGSAGRGFLTLGLFWLGTVPALASSGWLTQAILQPFGKKFPKFAAVVLIGLGFLSLGLKLKSELYLSEQIECHPEINRNAP